MNSPTPKRALFIVATALASLSALAAPPPPPGNEAGGPPMRCGPEAGISPGLPPYLRGLALSDDQQDRIFAIMNKIAPALRLKAREADQSRDALHRLSLADPFNDSKARLLAESMARAIADMEVMRARADYEVGRVLTPEQREVLANRRDRPERPEGRGEKR